MTLFTLISQGTFQWLPHREHRAVLDAEYLQRYRFLGVVNDEDDTRADLHLLDGAVAEAVQNLVVLEVVHLVLTAKVDIERESVVDHWVGGWVVVGWALTQIHWHPR